MRTAARSIVLLVAVAAPGVAQDHDRAEPMPEVVDVVVPGRQQLHGTPSGFPAFCTASRERLRSELRRDVVTKLKAIADAGRPALIAALGDDVPTEPLWLVNAVVARIPLERVDELKEHADVLAVFSAGLVLVSGAGNFRKQVEVPVQIRIPEGIPCVICVGGVTPKREVAPFSSIGPVEWESVDDYGDFPLPEGLIKPDLVAFPGPGLPLAGPGGENGYLPKNNARRGNSLSAPQVTGTVALMLSAHPELVPWRVREILEETARDILPEGKDVETGAGLLDAFAAVRRAIEIRDAKQDGE